MSEVAQVHSADGTHVGFERIGSGPPLLLVHGGTADRSRWAPVIPALSQRFTLLIPDRRGRGLSKEEADPSGYAIEREAEDLLAIAESVPGGGTVRVFAHSYGALVAIEAAVRSKAFGGMVLYEPPFATGGNAILEPQVRQELVDRLAADDREGALEHFYRAIIQVPEAAIDAMRTTAIWQARIAAVHTIVREADAAQAWTIDPHRLGAIQGPIRLLLGTETTPALDAASRALAQAMPSWELVLLEGQAHVAIDSATDLVVDRVLSHLY